jgi:hypothetical protein
MSHRGINSAISSHVIDFSPIAPHFSCNHHYAATGVIAPLVRNVFFVSHFISLSSDSQE